MLWNTISGPVHLKLFKLLGDLHILIEDAVLLVAGDLLDGLGVHTQHNAVGDESLPGGVVGDQLIFGLRVLPGVPSSGSQTSRILTIYIVLPI